MGVNFARRAAALSAAALFLANGAAARTGADPVDTAAPAGEAATTPGELATAAGEAASRADCFPVEAFTDDPEAVPVTQTPQTIRNTFNLEVSPRASVWTHDRNLNDQTVTAVGSVRARVSPHYGALDGFAQGFVQVVSEQGWSGDLVEAWMRVTSGNVEVKAGRQIVVWGRADGLNPTDVISSRNYTLLVARDDEQRRGNMMLQGRVALGTYTIDAYWLPEFRPNVFPIDFDRPGVSVLPDQAINDNQQFALKLDRSGGSVDWSLSWFHGIDRTRDFVAIPATPQTIPGSIVQVQQRFPSIDMIGADIAGTVGEFGYRAEAAYTAVNGPNTIYRKNSNIWFVAGIDTTLGNGWHVNLQYSLRYIFNYSDPLAIPNPIERAVAAQSAAVNNQLSETQSGATFHANRSFLQDTLDVELTTIVYFQPTNAALMPQVTYAINDRVYLAAGADIFLGPELSYFGRVRSISGGHVQLNFGF